MRTRHLVPALLVILLAVGAIIGGDFYAQSVERQYIHALAPRKFNPQVKELGSALQARAFEQPDLLPIYGSSELDASYGPYHASELFKTYPSGFTIFPVGHAGTTDLIMLQDLAAAGTDLRGKKVVISLSPPWFTNSMAGPESYAGNFSALHAGELAFSMSLSFEVKQGAAKRMSMYPKTLQNLPILKFALERLADGSPLSRVLYYACLPLGKLQNVVLRLQDHWDTLNYIWAQQQHGLAADSVHRPASLDWRTLVNKADKEQRQSSTNNPFGFDNNQWTKTYGKYAATDKNSQDDSAFTNRVSQSAEWTDLELLLQGAHELGVKVMVLSMPFQGCYYDYKGVDSVARRQAYYDKLNQITEAYDVPMLDFADHDEDKYFLVDPGAHVSRKGWIYYDEALDAFYRGTIRDYQGALAWYKHTPRETTELGNLPNTLLSSNSGRTNTALR